MTVVVRCEEMMIALLLALTLACAAESPSPARTPAAVSTEQSSKDIRHIEPAPDSVGPQPTRFVWSKVDGAESYWFRIWNEADVRVANETGIQATSVEFPADADMPAGTYFWSVVAMRGDATVAESGLAAFVVRKP